MIDTFSNFKKEKKSDFAKKHYFLLFVTLLSIILGLKLHLFMFPSSSGVNTRASIKKTNAKLFWPNSLDVASTSA